MFAYSLKLALQSLRHNRSLTVLMVITIAIAIGIAACMTTLTVYRLLAADPLPHKSARFFIRNWTQTPPPATRSVPRRICSITAAPWIYGAQNVQRGRPSSTPAKSSCRPKAAAR